MKKKNRLNFGWLVITLGLVAAIGFGFGPAFAQDRTQDEALIMGEDFQDPDIPEEGDGQFGQNIQATWLGVWDFQPQDSRRSEREYFSDRETCIYNGEPDAVLHAPIRLPSGARLQSARLWHYDGLATERNILAIYRAYPNNGQTTVCLAASTNGFSGGYDFGPNVTCNHTISNGGQWYGAQIELGQGAGDGDAMCLLGVRLLWYRQVRAGLPNPFLDIGGLNARFQNAIKALAASGITGGCSTFPPLYCPDAPVNRGQMAVFIAEALGLYWADRKSVV